MQWVALVYLACLQARQFGNRLFDGPGFSLLLPHQTYRAELRRQEHKPPSGLRYAEFRTVDHFMRNVESLFLQSIDEPPKHFLFG